MQIVKAFIFLSALFLTAVSACTTDDRSANDRCPFVDCRKDEECASGSCHQTDDIIGDGYCNMQGWLIAVIVIASLLVFGALVLCCVCCCRQRQLKKELHVHNYNGLPA